MNEKHMHIRKLTIPTLTMAILCSQLLGCGVMSQSDLLKMINDGDMIEIEIAVPNNVVAADEDILAWIILASLTSQETMRAQWDDTLKITMTSDGKNGCLYVDTDGKNENNTTLRLVLHNRAFVTMLEDPDIIASLAEAADKAYTDVDSIDSQDKAFYMALNGYFNLLPDAKDGASNADDALSRKEFMAMVARAELPVDDTLKASQSFNDAVGKSEFNTFAEQEAKYSYLDLESKSLNNKTYNGTMSRGEAVYLLVNRFYSDDLAKVGTMSAQFTDCKDGGNIAEQQKFIENGTKKDYYRDYEMVYALQNPDLGCPSSIYNAMVVARNKGLITDETRWDEGITKYEAMKLITEALKQDTSMPQFEYEAGGLSDIASPKAENTADQTEVTTVADGGVNVNETDEFFEVDETNEEEVYTAEVILDQDSEGTLTESDMEESDIESLSGTKYSIQQCNTRKGPSVDYEKVGGLSYGQEVQVTGQSKSTGWYEIEINGEKQFVSNKFLSDSKPEPLPVEVTSNTNNNSNNNSSVNTSNSSNTDTTAQASPDSEGYGYPESVYVEGLPNVDASSLEWDLDCF